MYSTVDLFAGAGGLSLGFRQTGKYDIKAAFENNPVMQKTYKRNHPETDVYGDVCVADYKKIKEQYGEIDVVIGGPPCQGFSNANRQKNHVISRNNAMVKEYVRAVAELKPKAFVMENVSMLSSDVHRFYLCSNDIPLVESGKVETKDTELLLLDEEYMFEDAIEVVQDKGKVLRFLWPENDFKELNVIFKASKNVKKLVSALSKHKSRLTQIAKNHIHTVAENEILKADTTAFRAIQMYYADVDVYDVASLQEAIAPAIMYQKMLEKAMEIFDNNLVVERYIHNDGLCAVIRSYAVFDYFNAVLGAGQDGYIIKSKVLSAADFGAPQKRMRFVAIGIRRDIATDVEMPIPVFKEQDYRTVSDAIEDISDIQPVYSTDDDIGIEVKSKTEISDLASSLRDSKILRNHIITKTTDVALERFRAIKPGGNFHSLTDEMKTNTYTDVSRTQNTIYLRLKYDEPSGTVVNVRKSMWIHPTEDRAISIREAARLQTFPDSFIFTGTKDKQYQQVGNAVPPILAKAIAQTLAEQLESTGLKGDG
ncbi:MAG: DNA cytosine methyltransferase [Lachnospiraceae bacterium]|nr:DNA cytosine methyltransferase [Lachnospiraceae bacterium]